MARAVLTQGGERERIKSLLITIWRLHCCRLQDVSPTSHSQLHNLTPTQSEHSLPLLPPLVHPQRTAGQGKVSGQSSACNFGGFVLRGLNLPPPQPSAFPPHPSELVNLEIPGVRCVSCDVEQRSTFPRHISPNTFFNAVRVNLTVDAVSFSKEGPGLSNPCRQVPNASLSFLLATGLFVLATGPRGLICDCIPARQRSHILLPRASCVVLSRMFLSCPSCLSRLGI